MIVYDDLDANEPVKVYDSGYTARTAEERDRLLFEYRAGDVYSPKIPPREALANLVADFIGDVNILEGKVKAAGNGRVEIAGEDFTVRALGDTQLAMGASAGFAIRPEKLKISRTAPADATINASEGEIWDIAYLGDMTVFHVRLPSGKVVKTSMLNAQREVENPIGYDEKVWVSFAETGGVHASGLFSVAGELILVREDVGRHNALDKLVGWALAAGRIPLDDNVLLVSGRVSYEILQKSIAAGIPIVAAVGAPSSLAIELAEQFGVTLVGFLRGGAMNAYAGAERLG